LAENEGSVTKIFEVLSHPIRRDILDLLSEKGEYAFTDLLMALKVDSGKLSFHLRSLQAFTEQTPTGKYKLNQTGESAMRVIRDVSAWAEGADVESKSSQIPYASFKKRVYAFLIDFALILGITGGIFGTELLPLLWGTSINLDPTTLIFITLALLWAYSTLLEGFKGQTIGKRIIKLRVVRVDGKKMSYDYAAVRNFGKAFLLPFDLLVGLKHEAFLRYFDKFAGTTVIDLKAQLSLSNPVPTAQKNELTSLA
jgi:uncharacterized RDD family membrane protein YckC/DNA-binding transcriptional ArsR family regulator